MTNYTLKIDNVTASQEVVHIETASLAVVSYAARDAQKELERVEPESQFRVYLAEKAPSLPGAPYGPLLEMTADAETVSDVLKTRLAKVRKSAGKSAAGQEETAGSASYSEEQDNPQYETAPNGLTFQAEQRD